MQRWNRVLLIVTVSTSSVFVLFMVLVWLVKIMKQGRDKVTKGTGGREFVNEETYLRRKRIRKCVECAFKIVVYLFGATLIAVATTLIGIVVYFGLKIALPLVITPGTWWFHIHQLLAYFLAGNILFNYYACVLTNPGNTDSRHYKRAIREGRETGRIPSTEIERDTSNGKSRATCGENAVIINVSEASEVKGAKHSNSNLRTRGANSVNTTKSTSFKKVINDDDPLEWRICGRSGLIKPPRAHYDAVSGKIVLNMDHFCPWVSNTVGYANYRYFLLMCLWTFIGCFYVVVMLTPYILKHGLGPRFFLLLIYVVSFSFLGVLLAFLLFHAMLISTGQTTIDFWANNARLRRARARGDADPVNPFDLGIRRNWEQVFGRMHWFLAILPSLRDPPWPPFATLSDEHGKNMSIKAASSSVPSHDCYSGQV